MFDIMKLHLFSPIEFYCINICIAIQLSVLTLLVSHFVPSLTSHTSGPFTPEGTNTKDLSVICLVGINAQFHTNACNHTCTSVR